jgi:hypothetical protein
MPSYVSNFKKFMKSEESKEVELGANPQMVEEDDASLLTDPDLVKIQDQIRNLEKQLEAVKQQEETKLRDLRTKAAAAQAEAQKQQAAAPQQPVQPTA